MNTKKALSAIIAAVMCLSVFSACSNNAGKETTNSRTQAEQSRTADSSSADAENSDNSVSQAEDSPKPGQNSQTSDTENNMHTLYIRDTGKHPELTAFFLNNVSGTTEDAAMTKVSENDEYITYSCNGDTAKYNMIRIKYGDNTLQPVAFNKFANGWYLKNNALFPYVEGETPDYAPKYKTEVFQFDGYDKNVYIWTPDDYDAKSEEKYSTIYMIDGQNAIDKKLNSMSKCWNAAESVESMMSLTKHKAIIVGIETTGSPDNKTAARDDELIPDLGVFNEPEGMPEEVKVKSKKRGEAFADFVCDTLMPAIQKEYNVYDDKEHTFLAGSSFGGLETFYTVLAHPDKFGAGGIFSATLSLFYQEDWEKFLDGCNIGSSSPFLYFYAGSYGFDNGDACESMNNRLIERGYPKEKIVFSKYEPGQHNEDFWRSVFPEFLEAAFSGRLNCLEEGAEVKYEDRTSPNEVTLSEEDKNVDLDTLPDYIYFDNSETKWEKVYAFWWGFKTVNKITGEDYSTDWPGYEMERIEGTDIYRIAVPLGPIGFLFDSGVTDEEVKRGATAYQTDDLSFSVSRFAGKIYKIDLSQKPEAGKGIEKTKFCYHAGTWSDYKE